MQQNSVNEFNSISSNEQIFNQHSQVTAVVKNEHHGGQIHCIAVCTADARPVSWLFI